MTERNSKKFYHMLPEFTKTFNATINRKTGLAPNDITDENSQQVWKKMWSEHVKMRETPRPPPKFSVGTKVRIGKNKLLFSKGEEYNKTYGSH